MKKKKLSSTFFAKYTARVENMIQVLFRQYFVKALPWGRLCRSLINTLPALASILACPPAEAVSKKNGYDLGLGIGYRNDEWLFSIAHENGQYYKERDRNLKAVVLDGYFDLMLWGFQLSSYADVGWFVSGNTHDTCMMGVSNWPVYRTSFHQDVGGLMADCKELFGAIFDFTNRHGGFKVIPEVGYGVFYQDIHRKGNHPESQTFPDEAILSCDLSHYQLQRQWCGPLAGGRLIYQMLHAWWFEGGYYYYFLQMKQKFGFDQRLIYLTGQSLASEFFIKSHNRVNFSSLHGQNFCGKIQAQVANSWKLNWRWDLYRFATKKKKKTNKQEIQQVYPVFQTTVEQQKDFFKARWSAFSSIFEVEYFF